MSGETEERPSGWTTDTLNAHLQRQVDDLRATLQERYETQTKAVDAAFLAQQTAMSTALTAAERAVATALLSAEKAVTKAEVASEKRFEGVNEFRQTLTDQAAHFMTRVEGIALIDRNAKDIQELKDRMNTREGHGAGVSAALAAALSLAGLIPIIIALIYFAQH